MASFVALASEFVEEENEGEVSGSASDSTSDDDEEPPSRPSSSSCSRVTEVAQSATNTDGTGHGHQYGRCPRFCSGDSVKEIAVEDQDYDPDSNLKPSPRSRRSSSGGSGNSSVESSSRRPVRCNSSSPARASISSTGARGGRRDELICNDSSETSGASRGERPPSACASRGVDSKNVRIRGDIGSCRTADCRPGYGAGESHADGPLENEYLNSEEPRGLGDRSRASQLPQVGEELSMRAESKF